jgi:uncharacterized protein (TIGR01244 family)
MVRLKAVLKTSAVLLLVLGSFEIYQLTTESTSFTSSIAHVVFANNLHEVVPGKFYRSSEVKVRDFIPEVKRLGVHTVIDVRLGPKTLSHEYLGEEEALQRAQVYYRHFPLTGSKEMTKTQVLSLLKLLDEAAPPLLVHCSSGTHRSGVVSAIYLMEKEGVPFEEAIKQLSPKYGFFAAERRLKSVISGRPTIDNILWRYGEFLKNNPGVTFRGWVERYML